MDLKIRKNGESYIIDVNGEMDLYNSYKLKELVMKMLERKVERFIINLENVDYIDSSGIGALIYICSTIKKMGFRLVITNIHGSVKKVIELTKLWDISRFRRHRSTKLLKRMVRSCTMDVRSHNGQGYSFVDENSSALREDGDAAIRNSLPIFARFVILPS